MTAGMLQRLVAANYSPSDYPALRQQAQQWATSRPWAGARVLDVTPVFTNTLAKYVPLIAGGAQLSVALSPLLPHDPAVVAQLDQMGVPVTTQPGEYDVVMDCAGVRADNPATAGYVELTKSGAPVYAGCQKPVFLVDDSRIKLIETSLGTGDGFLRGLAHFGHPDVSGRSVVIFGAGKVGRGAALRALTAGAHVTVIDPDPAVGTPRGCMRVDPDQACGAVSQAWCVVSATGTMGALGPLCEALESSPAILVNLGAEDEFGPDMPADRVLNDKLPVNFALAEPTHLRYLDATMALVNVCGLALLSGDHPPGLQPPPTHLEDEILSITPSSLGQELQDLQDHA